MDALLVVGVVMAVLFGCAYLVGALVPPGWRSKFVKARKLGTPFWAIPFLGFDLYNPNISGVPWWIVIGATLGIMYYFFGMGSRAGADGVRRFTRAGGLFLVILVVLAMFPTVPGTGTTAGPLGHAAPTFTITLDTGTGNCFNFPAFSTDAVCNTAAGLTTDNNAYTVVANSIASHTSAAYTQIDTLGIKVTVRRTDPGWLEANSNGLKATIVSCAIVWPGGTPPVLPSTNLSTVRLVEQDPNGLTWQVAWVDNAANSIVGKWDGGAQISLSPAGSGTCTNTIYFSESVVKQYTGTFASGVPGTVIANFYRTFTIAVSMSDGGSTVSIPVYVNVQEVR